MTETTRQQMMRYHRISSQHRHLASVLYLHDREDQLRGRAPPDSFVWSDTATRAADRWMGRAIELLAASKWW